MTAQRDLVDKVQRWKERRNISLSESDFDEEDDTLDSESESMTGVFTKSHSVDKQMMFNAAASRSEKIHRLNQTRPDPIVAQQMLEHWASFF